MCSSLLPDYQAHMIGFDVEIGTAYYNVGRRSNKWWKRIFSSIIECATLILDSCGQPATHVQRGRAKRYLLAFKLDSKRPDWYIFFKKADLVGLVVLSMNSISG